MHAFLVSSPPDQHPPGPDCLHLIPDTSIGITEIRQIQTFLSRKPLRLPENVVVIHRAELLTLPAQHALLKTLEEPPGNSLIYLVTAFPEQLLPTILSRTQSADPSIHRDVDTATIKKSLNLIHQLLAAGVGERLVIAQSQNFTRESLLQFLDHLEVLLHRSINSLHPALKIPKTGQRVFYTVITTTRKFLQANVNVRLCTDYLVFNL